MTTLLVAMDFTEASERALALGAELARGIGANLHLLHVVEPIDDPEEADEETREFHRDLEEKARLRLEETLASFSGLEVNFSVVLGHRHLAILRVAREREARVIVMGTTPRQPDRPSVSHQVAALADRPVLLVP